MEHPRAARRRNRYRQIAEVLVRHGLGYLVGVAGLERFVPLHRGWFGHPRREAPYTRPEHVRMAVEDLGTTFIKLGQILSTRADLLPPAFQTELAKLQDQAPPVPADQVVAALVEEFGRPVGETFAWFELEPLAAASIGQVHAARLPDGTEVVVKVRRPGVVALVHEDLEILGTLASAASRRWALADEYDMVGLAEEFAQTLRAELDYVREGQNAARFAADFRDDPDIHVPRVFWEWTTARVLTLERIQGIKISDTHVLDEAGIDRVALAHRAAGLLLKMVFEHGFFHADPHPGNFFVEPGGRIGLIDYGMVGTVDARTQGQLTRLLLAITSDDPARLVDAFLELGVARQRIERTLLRRDLEHLLLRYYTRPLGEVALGPLIEDALGIVRRHRLRLPTNLVLLLKTAVMSEGLGAQLDPSFRLTEALTPYAERLVLRQLAPARWARQLGQASLDAAQLGVELPQQLRRLLADLERGDMEIGVRPAGAGPLVERLEQLVHQVVLSIIVGSFIVGLASLMSIYHPPDWERWAGAVFATAFAIAGGLGVYLVVSVLRSRRR